MEDDSRKEMEAKMTGERRTMKIRGKEVVYWVRNQPPPTPEEIEKRMESICHRIENPYLENDLNLPKK
jgi:hypothetical protein